MRELRKQLIARLGDARREQHLPVQPPRLAACLVHDLLALLSLPLDKTIALNWRLISRGHLHRHVICIRCPDQAFYLDAVKGYCARHGIQPLETQAMVVKLSCDAEGRVTAIEPPASEEELNFMFIVLHVSATLVPDGQRLQRDLLAVLHAVDLSVRDFHPMCRALAHCQGILAQKQPQAAELLAWMIDDHYLFFGLQDRQRRFGLLRNKRVLTRVAPGLMQELQAVPPPRECGIEWLHLAASQHYLYSAASLQVVRISWHERKRLNSAILLGHFSRSARHANASRVPLLAHMWRQLLRRPLLAQSAFYRREIRTLFDRLPKSLLLAVRTQELVAPLKAVVDLAGPVQTATALLTPRLGNVQLLLAAMPAERFGPNVLERISRLISQLGIQVHGHLSFGIGAHRLLLLTLTGATKRQASELGECIQRGVIFWKDEARAAILAQARMLSVPAALKAVERLPPLYEDMFPPQQLVEDLKMLAWVRQKRRTSVRVQPCDGGVELHLFSLEPPPLGRLVTMVQAFGLTAMQEAVVDFGEDDAPVRLSSLRCKSKRRLLPADLRRLNHALEKVFNDEADDDAANALVLAAAMDIEQVMVLITLRNHLVQLLPDAATSLLTRMLNRYPQVAAKLYQLFEARHRPAMTATFMEQAKIEFDKAMTEVEALTDDTWFRALAELVASSVRTNAYIREATEPLAVKIDPRRLSFGPRPLPFREIFVHGTHVEGVHLRAGPVARGGIRHSNRPADFRTEVLELMATQVVKNGVIVPTGAKGGFVVRHGNGADFVRSQYRRFIRTLLSLTDNRMHGEIVPPPGVRIHPEDAEDAYLVVAADKGTATFSDAANEEARLAGFWLDDAFASGGRHGYDHKAVGITAKGAWVCIAEHFKALGMDAYRDAISCVGIGDMGGDVFGNGMLINPNIRLLAAFNHRHIFLDPDPDAAKAHAERRRLFAAGGDWDGYKPECISAGGGVFARNAKRIELSPEARQALAIPDAALSGEALIRAILTAPVDLLYNGGIGTYVKSSEETHAQVRDPANNAVRVDAGELRCKVVGEGGNLGFTQRARLEYAAAGGRINTDAIDNSAGVDMSDHEVNLKILFSSISQGPLPISRRNRLLKAMTGEVAGQCLADNLAQSRLLHLAAMEAADFRPRFERLRGTLVAEQRIDRRIDPCMHEAENDALRLRPQLAVLIGHEKNRIHDSLRDRHFHAHSSFGRELLFTYFPKRLHRRFATAIEQHPLAGEIVNTMAANRMLNDLGLSCVHHLQTLLDHPIDTIVEALLMSDFILDGATLRRAVWDKVGEHGAACTIQRSLQENLLRFAEDLLRLCRVTELDAAWLQRQQRQLKRFRRSLAGQGIAGSENRRFLGLLKQAGAAGLDPEHATHLAAMPELCQAAVAVHLSSTLDLPLSRCLIANQACLHLLPFAEAEAPLRTPSWSDTDAHALRREWLHRLSILKSRAVRQLLSLRALNLLAAGERLWQAHPYWAGIQKLRQQIRGEEEPERMRLLLLLTRLESLIDDFES